MITILPSRLVTSESILMGQLDGLEPDRFQGEPLAARRERRERRSQAGTRH